MKYAKLPVEIEAFQIGDWDNEPEWFTNACIKEQIIIWDESGHGEVETLEGVMRFRYGDYIIRGIKGELYPCRKDIFEETYEKVE